MLSASASVVTRYCFEITYFCYQLGLLNSNLFLLNAIHKKLIKGDALSFQ